MEQCSGHAARRRIFVHSPEEVCRLQGVQTPPRRPPRRRSWPPRPAGGCWSPSGGGGPHPAPSGAARSAAAPAPAAAASALQRTGPPAAPSPSGGRPPDPGTCSGTGACFRHAPHALAIPLVCTDWCMVGLRLSLHWHLTSKNHNKAGVHSPRDKAPGHQSGSPSTPFCTSPLPYLPSNLAPFPLEHEILDACCESCSGQLQYGQRQHPPRQSRARLWIKPRASGSCTVSKRAGQLWALSRSKRCLVVSSNTHSPKAKMSMLRVYWFSKLSSGSTAAREHHQFLSNNGPELWRWQPPARSGSL